MILVKFMSTSYLVANLENSQLYFNNVARMNDADEGKMRFTSPADFESFYLQYFNPERLSYYRDRQDLLLDKINSTFAYRYETNGVCCFCSEDNLLNKKMWSLYADNNKGVCLIFDGTLAFSPKYLESEALISSPVGPIKVSYIDSDFDTDPTMKQLTQENFLTTKWKDWAEEKEYRFISPKVGPYMFPKTSLKQVVFGEHFDLSERSTILTVIGSVYPKAITTQIKRVDGGLRIYCDAID